MTGKKARSEKRRKQAAAMTDLGYLKIGDRFVRPHVAAEELRATFRKPAR